jgi:hypothetical protein
LILKVAEFCLQVLACLLFSFSHLAIWYFCRERTEAKQQSVEPPRIDYEYVSQKELPRPGGQPELPMFSKLPPLPARTISQTSVSSQPVSSHLSSMRAPQRSWGDTLHDVFATRPPAHRPEVHTYVLGSTRSEPPDLQRNVAPYHQGTHATVLPQASPKYPD